MPLLRPCAVSALQRPATAPPRRTAGVLAAARTLVRGRCLLPAVFRAAGRASQRAAAPGSRRGRVDVSAVAGTRTPQAGGMSAQGSGCFLTTSITATTVQAALVELREAEAAGADVVELRLDFLQGFQPATDLPALLAGTKLPAIVTYRPNWEGGKYAGAEEARLHALWLAVELKAAYVDVELKAAAPFFAASPKGWQRSKSGTRFILSSHNYSETPSVEDLRALHARAVAAGADIVKIATTAQRIVDVARLEALLSQEHATPTIALGMGEAGLVSRLLAPKFGSFLTFGALRAGKESAPGQPTLAQLRSTYRLSNQSGATRVLGVIGKPISHSRSPVLHNAALQSLGEDIVYVPLLVDDLPDFLHTPLFGGTDFAGFSVTIPHKEVALRCCAEVDPVAQRIGAVNTLVRRPDGTLKGYNTDCTAALDAIEKGMGASVSGKTVLVVGAGGAGRAVAFEAAHRGARVLISNRSDERAVSLAADVGAESVKWEALQNGSVRADVLANTTSLGMQPDVDGTPVPAAALSNFSLVFDAVYTPLETRLLREAKLAGAVAVNGVDMFVGQAARQFTLFTGKPPPMDLMRATLMASLNPSTKL